MKIYLGNQSQQKLGGGWTFLNTFRAFLTKQGHEVVYDWHEADVYFLSGSTMVTPQEFDEVKAAGKKIVLRIDNIPRNSRNRNTGTSRLERYAKGADLVIYQSDWAKDFVGGWLNINGPVILNGAHDDIFHPNGGKRPKDGDTQCLFVQYNRDETKRWHECWYEFTRLRRKDPKAHLWIVGQFSPELVEYGFDFFEFGKEAYDYLGVIDDPLEMAEVMRGANYLFLPYYNDACSNTLIEFIRCHNTQEGPYPQLHVNTSGGSGQILETRPEFLSASVMTARYVEEISKIL